MLYQNNKLYKTTINYNKSNLKVAFYTIFINIDQILFLVL